VKLSGIVAWLVWLFVHLMYIVQFQNRVLVFIQWGFEYLTFNRGARLITGYGRLPKAPPVAETESVLKV
jgi:NADH:ubiquinone reductase (H+-translocating)